MSGVPDDLRALYQEVILDHYRKPRNFRQLDPADREARGYNPLCGDEVTIDLTFNGDTVTEVAVESQGCSISQSSASMMTEAIKGKTRSEIESLTNKFKSMMSIEEDTDLELDPERPGSVLGDIEALQGVRQYPVRIKCANLGWTVLAEALSS